MRSELNLVIGHPWAPKNVPKVGLKLGNSDGGNLKMAVVARVAMVIPTISIAIFEKSLCWMSHSGYSLVKDHIRSRRTRDALTIRYYKGILGDAVDGVRPFAG